VLVHVSLLPGKGPRSGLPAGTMRRKGKYEVIAIPQRLARRPVTV
jgi:hypothetical protein